LIQWAIFFGLRVALMSCPLHGASWQPPGTAEVFFSGIATWVMLIDASRERTIRGYTRDRGGKVGRQRIGGSIRGETL
jgi:hypothetical protein